MSEEKKPAVQEMPSEIPIHFIKGNQFRVAHANGAWFGADPQGNFHLTFYSERAPIPTKIFVKLNKNGQLMEEDVSKREGKQGLVREMEIDIVMPIAAAQGLLQLLDQNVKTAIAYMEAANKSEAL